MRQPIVGVFDPDDASSERTRTFFEGMGWRVVHGRNAHEADVWLARSRIDLLVITSRLPGVDDLSWIYGLWEEYPESKVIYTITEWVDEALEYLSQIPTVARVFLEPFADGEMKLQVRRLFGRTPMSSPDALQDIRRDLMDTLPGRVGELSAAVRRAIDTRDKTHLEEALRIAHNVYGTTGTYGMMAFSEPARRCEIELRRLLEDPSAALGSSRLLSYHVAQLKLALGDDLGEELTADSDVDTDTDSHGTFQGEEAEEGWTADDGSVVLAVDDDPHFVQWLTAILGQQGIEVVYCDQPAKVLEFMEECRPKLVVLDVMMPFVNGFDVARFIRAEEKWADVPIVFASTMAVPTVRSACYRAGGDDFLRKPVDEEELQERVVARIRRPRRSSSSPR